MQKLMNVWMDDLINYEQLYVFSMGEWIIESINPVIDKWMNIVMGESID